MVAVAALMVLIALPSAPASAAGCYGSGCEGKDPGAMGCSAYTAAEFTRYGVRYELRYSSGCRAAWTRVTSTYHSNTDFAQIGKFWCGDKYSCRYGVYGVQVKEGQYWTLMMGVSGGVAYRACNSSWFDGAPRVCTGARYF